MKKQCFTSKQEEECGWLPFTKMGKVWEELVWWWGGIDQEFDFKHFNFGMSIRHLSGEGKNKDDV